MPKKQKNAASAKEVLKYLGTAEAHNVYILADRLDVALDELVRDLILAGMTARSQPQVPSTQPVNTRA